MKKNSESRKGWFSGKNRKILCILMAVLALLLVVLAGMVIAILRPSPVDTEDSTARTEPTAVSVETTAPALETEPQQTTQAETVPPETEPVMLAELAELYAENPDLAGWLKIDDTVIDYPVMFCKEDGERYLYANFKGRFSTAGTLFIDDDCDIDPESDNLLIYGHNMGNGTMFGTLMQYAKEKYWKAHPVIQFSTLYEKREYEIVAAFYDRVYYNYEDCFKFYRFINAEDEAQFDEAMAYFKEHSEYDTGVTPEYGDRFITLITCAYHVKNGRFVVIARQITEETNQ